MALTPKITPLNGETSGKGRAWEPLDQWKRALGNLTFNAADIYTTGGFTIIRGAQVGTTGTQGTFPSPLETGLGIRRIEDIAFTGSGSTGTGNLSGELYASYDYTNQVVKLFQIGRATDNTKPAPDTEVTNGATLTGVVLQFEVIGI